MATIEVVREWKGPGKRRYRAATSAASSANCGSPFSVGEYILMVGDGTPRYLDDYCGKEPLAAMRLLIAAYDAATGRKPLEIPDDLR